MLMEKVTVIIIWIVKIYCCVAKTTAKLDQLAWTVAQMMVTSVQNFPVMRVRVIVMMIQNVRACSHVAVTTVQVDPLT